MHASNPYRFGFPSLARRSSLRAVCGGWTLAALILTNSASSFTVQEATPPVIPHNSAPERAAATRSLRSEYFVVERALPDASIDTVGVLSLTSRERNGIYTIESELEFADGLRVFQFEQREGEIHRFNWRELGGGDLRTWVIQGRDLGRGWLEIQTTLWGTKLPAHGTRRFTEPATSPWLLLEELRESEAPERDRNPAEQERRILIADPLRQDFELLRLPAVQLLSQGQLQASIETESPGWSERLAVALALSSPAASAGADAVQAQAVRELRNFQWLREDGGPHTRYLFHGSELVAIELQRAGLWAWRVEQQSHLKLLTIWRRGSKLAGASE